MLCHLAEGLLSWTERKPVQDRIKARKELIIQALKPGEGHTGIKYTMPDNRGFGGNTTTLEVTSGGNQCRKEKK